jgi:2-polyprenyl-3-methyl-5-hydroxy-6-metoxy-1,4-benzoquinol methylase
VGLTAPRRHRATDEPPAAGHRASVVWHDLECGLYRADLPLWRELAEQAREQRPAARILDVGAGTGRVTLDLARAGHAVTALDLDADLLGALSERATNEGLQVQTVRADARSFALDRGDFALCVAPMQTVQLLGGPAQRAAFMQRARAHLLPGGVLAVAIVTELEPFDCTDGDLGPSPEVAAIEGVEYVSHATRVHLGRRTARIERERRIIHKDDESARVALPARVVHAPEPERDVIELDRVSARALQREGLDAGLSHVGVRAVPATEEHVGSEVVVLRA